MSNEKQSCDATNQGELSDADLSQASGGKSRDYASTEAPGGQCYDGVITNATPNFQWNTVSNSKLGSTTTGPASDPTL